MRVQWGKDREEVESFLLEVFEIVVGTGRRISAVCRLRYENLDFEKRSESPWGAIVWPEDTDKMGKLWRCPMSEHVRQAIEATLRKRLRVGPGPLFPAPKDRDASVRYELVSKWLEEAEKLASWRRRTGASGMPTAAYGRARERISRTWTWHKQGDGLA
jgi:integrase